MARSVVVQLVALLLLVSKNDAEISGGMLFPRESESRQIKELDGMWNFRADTSPNRNEGMEQKWYLKPLSMTGPVIPMPVPSSYNDITTDKSLRDFVGWVWYDREFFVTKDWTNNQRVVLRIDSAHYYSNVWINGQLVMEHDGGHLPFESKVNDLIYTDKPNRLTVAVNNTLTPYTLPCGSIEYMNDTSRYPSGYFVQNLQFDFFNYAGIHRRVRLYTTPETYIDDITVVTQLSGSTGMVEYNITALGPGPQSHEMSLLDAQGTEVASAVGNSGKLTVPNANLWWPYTMNDTYGYMYTLKVRLKSTGTVDDIYRLPIGIRTVKVTTTQLLINDKPFYCHGVAKHEDSDFRGKGLDFPLIARDFNMLKWLGANCFRTSHYPYAEEILDEANRWGVVVIDEATAVGLKSDENMSNRTLEHHKMVMEELVRRDKNKPAVVMWSVANEPDTSKTIADYYFKTIISHTRGLDPTRLVTYVDSSSVSSDKAGKYTDIQCINRYFGWYSDTGHTEVIQLQLAKDLNDWYNKLQKPLIMTEYGADTVAGLHTMPSFIFTEEYQVEFLAEYHKVFDDLRKKFLVGEMVWNFADFMTDQSTTRVVGNKKGLLTRQRQPKASGHLMRERYWRIINETLPSLKTQKQLYQINKSSLKFYKIHEHL